MTERELIRKVKKKDDIACKELIEMYRNMIYKIINSYNLDRGDYIVPEDELFQEGCLAIYEACWNYSRINNCKFSTFVYIVIKRRINRAIQKQIEIYKHETVSYDKYDNIDRNRLFENSCVYDNPIEYSNKEYVKKQTKLTISKLKKIDQKIINLRLQNYSYDQISKMLNIPKKRIDNKLQYLKRKNFHNN